MKSSAANTALVPLWIVGLVAVFSFHSGGIRAAEPDRTSIEFDRIDIPADQPSSWPKEIEKYDEFPRGEFLSMLEQIRQRNSNPRSASLRSVHYEATLVNDTLKGGVLTAFVQRLNQKPTLLELGQYSFALEDLKWQNRPAIWGSSADGRTWVLNGADDDELLGEWTCRGRKIPGGIDFDLQLPPATISFLDLRVPRNYSLSSPGSEVTLLTEQGSEHSQLWRIHCGINNRCRLTMLDTNELEKPRQALIVENDMQVIVREEDLRFQLILYLESLDAAVQNLTLKVPSDVEIYSAVYGGDNPVSLTRTAETDTDGRWTVHLPSPLSGRRRTLRIDGIAVQKPGQPTILPQVNVENSIFDGGHLGLTIQSPLQVRSFRANGYRQRTSEGDSFTFQQLATDARMILDVHRAQVSLSGQTCTFLWADDDSWNLTSEIVWKSQSGVGYQTVCLFPSEWQITDVRLKSDNEARHTAGQSEEFAKVPNAPRMNWEVQSNEGRESKLSIEFLEVIQPGQPRFVKVHARRRPPRPGQLVSIPLPHLLNCETSEVLLGLQFPNTMTASISAESRLERVARPESNLFEIPTEKSGYEQRWFRGDSLDGSGTIQLTPRLQPVAVRTETSIEALPAEYRIKYSIQSERPLGAADRLLVYLTESNFEVRWTWKGQQSFELSPTRISKSQHIEWNLPANGELWEIRLPRDAEQGMMIEGTATNRWIANSRPALVFIPQAVDKQAELTVSHPSTVELDFDTDGLKPTSRPMTWSYSTPQAEFGLSLRNPLPSRDFPLMVSVELRTLMSADAEGSDLYRARLQLENGSSQESLRVRLDPSAVLQEVFVAGESIATTLQGGEFVIPGLNAAHRDMIEISYRVPARSLQFYERRPIVVPQVSAQVVGFFWEFGIPTSTAIVSEPLGIQLTRALPVAGWNQRLFGPLGRAVDERVFNPFRLESWRQLIQPSSKGSRESGGELTFLYRGIAPEIPAELSIELWQSDRVQLLAWISVGFFLFCGILIRVFGWKSRDRLAAYGLGLSVATTLFVPAPYFEFVGGATAGMLISILLPRYFLRRSNRIEQPTVEYRRFGSAIVTLLLVGVALATAVSSIETDLGAQESGFETSAVRRPKVYIAVDKNGEPSETVRLVYVAHDVLERWKALANEYATVPEYVISSARYQLQDLNESNLKLQARFQVHVFRSATPVTVLLGLPDLIVPDAESCRVNGRPYPISIVPGGNGYSVELPSKEDRSDESDKEGESIADEGVVSYEIVLEFRKPRPAADVLDLRIPKIAHSELEVKLSDVDVGCEIVGGLGDREQAGVSIQNQLGSISTAQVRWSNAVAVVQPARLTASLLQHIELHPAYSELIFHLNINRLSGKLDALEFELPQNAVVRKEQLRAENLLRSDLITTREGQRRLRLIFDGPQQGPFAIAGTILLLQPDAFLPIPVPKFGIARAEGMEFQYERNWWGISTAANFQLEHAQLDPENVSTVPAEAYLEAWVSAADSRRHESMIPRQPQLTFELREGATPSFTLVPYPARRRAIQWRQTGHIGRNRLEWTLSGEIESSHVPTFQLVLLADRRLRIEKISVMENDAERLGRPWTESRGEPSRVVLFLSDKPQGKQTITLRGSLPIVPGTAITLPSIRVEDCDTLNARLTLTRDPEIDVEFTAPREWIPLTTDDPANVTPRSDSSVMIGSFQLNDLSVRGTIQTSSRHARSSNRASAWLRRLDDSSSWQLKYRLEMRPEGESPLRIGLAFPAAFTNLDSVTVSRAEPAWQDVKDGVRQLDLLLNRSERGGPVVIQFESTIAEPMQADWELPLPKPLYSSGQETLVVIDPENAWFPVGGRELAKEELPDWPAELFEQLPSNRLPVRISGATVELQKVFAQSVTREPMIRLLDQRIWLNGHGLHSGLTQAFVSSVQGDLEFELPDHVQVTSIFLDEIPVALPAKFNNRLKIPMTNAGAESLLTLTWRFESGQINHWGTSIEPLLWPKTVSVERAHLTILSDTPTTLWSDTELVAINSLDQGLDTLEALLDRQAVLGSETRTAFMNRWLIDQVQNRLKVRIPIEYQKRGDRVAQQIQRWTELVSRINQLERISPAPQVGWYVKLLEESAEGSKVSIRGRTEHAGPIHVWQFDWQMLKTIGAVVLTLILIPMFRQTIRTQWSEWMHQHSAISWLILAAIWWCFLTPSALGVFLTIVAVWKALSQNKPVSQPSA